MILSSHVSRLAYGGVFLLVFIAAALGQVGLTHAAVSTNAATSLTNFNQTIKASSTPVAVIGINVVGTASEKVASASVAIIGSAGFATADLAALGTATSSGVALYRDNKSGGVTGSFDAADMVVPLAVVPTWSGATTTLSLLGDGEAAPADNAGANAGNDYFIVIQTASGATDAHAFTANMYPGSIQWDGANTPAGTPTAITTNTVTIDTVAPAVHAGKI